MDASVYDIYFLTEGSLPNEVSRIQYCSTHLQYCTVSCEKSACNFLCGTNPSHVKRGSAPSFPNLVTAVRKKGVRLIGGRWMRK